MTAGQITKFKLHIWDAEDNDMVTEDTDKMFYEMEEKVKAEDETYE